MPHTTVQLSALDYRYAERIEEVTRNVEQKGIDALLLVNRPNTLYLTGFTGTSSLILLGQNIRIFMTDGRYIERAKKTIKNLKVMQVRGNVFKLLTVVCKKKKIRKLGVEGDLPLTVYSILQKHSNMQIENADTLMTSLRMVKDSTEIEVISQSAAVTSTVFQKALKKIKRGVTEQTVSHYIHRTFEDSYNVKEAFENIVATGRNGSIPHAEPGSTTFKKGDLVVIDLGALKNGYCADMTRTVAVDSISERKKKIYEILLDVQCYTLEKVKPGVTCKHLYHIARARLAKARLAKYFTHGLGHGVGIDIHEGPVLGPESKDVLTEGNVITIEPGVYIPGYAGIRIEDLVLVTSDGCTILSNTPKTLQSVL